MVRLKPGNGITSPALCDRPSHVARRRRSETQRRRDDRRLSELSAARMPHCGMGWLMRSYEIIVGVVVVMRSSDRIPHYVFRRSQACYHRWILQPVSIFHVRIQGGPEKRGRCIFLLVSVKPLDQV